MRIVMLAILLMAMTLSACRRETPATPLPTSPPESRAEEEALAATPEAATVVPTQTASGSVEKLTLPTIDLSAELEFNLGRLAEFDFSTLLAGLEGGSAAVPMLPAVELDTIDLSDLLPDLAPSPVPSPTTTPTTMPLSTPLSTPTPTPTGRVASLPDFIYTVRVGWGDFERTKAKELGLVYVQGLGACLIDPLSCSLPSVCDPAVSAKSGPFTFATPSSLCQVATCLV